MTKNRKDTEEFILKYIGRLVKGDDNTNLYKNMFSKMTDKEFDEFMISLRDNKITLSIIIPAGSENNVSVENNFKLAKELGFEFFQHIKVTDNDDLPDYITPNKYLVYELPIKRAAQLLSKKISIPEHNTSIDTLSGQVTGKSKSSKLTLPELQILIGMGLNDSILELMKVRGGDLGEANAMNAMLYKQGRVSQEDLKQYSTGVVSTNTLRAYFNGMHIKMT